MNTIYQSNLLQFIFTQNVSIIESINNLDIYTEFKAALLSSIRNCKDYDSSYRLLQEIRSILSLFLEMFEENNMNKKNEILVCVKLSLQCVKTELLLLDNNHIFLPTNPIASQTSKKYPLYWNTSKFSKADIVSLLTALDAVEAADDNPPNPSRMVD